MNKSKGSISINAGGGVSLKTNGTSIRINGVTENSTGGVIHHKAGQTLIQTGNEMTASQGGKIINEVEDGHLIQTFNNIKSTTEGIVINKVTRSKLKIPILLVVLGVLADLIAVLSTGSHIWKWFSQ